MVYISNKNRRLNMRAAIYTLGCKVNQYESQVMRELLEKAGFEVVRHTDDADVYVVNSCAVTAESTRKSLKQVRHFKHLHPDSVTVLTGCVPQAFPKEADAVGETDVIFGNKDYERRYIYSNYTSYTMNRLRPREILLKASFDL